MKYMKKILIIGLILALLPSFVLAKNENSGSQGNGSGITVSTTENTISNQNQVSNQGENHNITEQEREEAGNSQGEQNRTRAHNITELKQQIQERKQEMKEELESMPKKEQKVYKNQNLVREAVHNLLDMRDLLDLKGGIGQNVSEIAREFNNSVQSTIKTEEKIQKRSMIVRILLGGDEDSADEISQEVIRNTERIQELKRLKEQVREDEELKGILQEQIQQIEQEQNRLQELTQKEKQSKGLFGWLFK